MNDEYGFPSPGPIIDVHVNLSRWPFRRLPDDEPQRLVAKLKQHGVNQALASSFDGLLHLDIGAVNRRLVRECAEFGQGILTPIGALNLSLPNWEADLEWCARTSAVRGVRIWPGYHNVPLDDPRFDSLCRLCSERDLLLQIVLRLEDARTEHERFTSTAVDVTPLSTLVDRYPKLRVVLINPGRDLRPLDAGELAKSEGVFFDIGMVEGAEGLIRYLEHVPAEQMLFGSHLPFFYFEAASLRLYESNPGERILKMITYENADRLLARS